MGHGRSKQGREMDGIERTGIIEAVLTFISSPLAVLDS
jgi:hypothetical protein